MKYIADTLSPCPKRIRELAKLEIFPSDLNIVVPPFSQKTQLHIQAGEELQKFIKDKLCDSPTLTESQEYGKRFNIIIGGWDKEKNSQHIEITAGFQAYSILSSKNRMNISGVEPEGAYYGVKTLIQALSFSKGKVILPLLEVFDSADMAERGFWDYFYPASLRPNSELNSITSATEWFKIIDILSHFKINLMELLVSGEHGQGYEGLIYNSTRFPELVEPGTAKNKNAVIREVIAYAKKRAVKIILGLVHPEQIAAIGRCFPETRAKNPQGCQPFLLEKLLCFSHPQTKKIISGIIEEISDKFSLSGAFIWMPEHLGYCSCDKCCDRWGNIASFMGICDHVNRTIRKRNPEFRLRILVSFMRYTDQVLKIIPPDVEVIYYECDRHGPYGFSKNKEIPERLTEANREGRRTLGCINYRGCNMGFNPLPYFSNIREWVEIMIQGGFYGIDGSVSSNPGVHLMNLLCMGEYAWNSKGRTIPKFIKATLFQLGKNHVENRAKVWSALSEGWNLYLSLHPRICDKHALIRILNLHKIDYLDSVYIVDTIEQQNLPDLREHLLKLENSMDAAIASKDEDLISMLDFCHSNLSFMLHVFSAFHIYGRQMWPDPEKGPWNDWIEELLIHISDARKKLYKIAKIARASKSMFNQQTPKLNIEGLSKLLDAILKVEFKEKMEKLEWPDINSFA